MTRLLSLLERPRAAWYVIGIAMVLWSPVLVTGLWLDDFWHWTVLDAPGVLTQYLRAPYEMFTFANGDPGRTVQIMEMGLFPWWTDPELKVSFWRPITALTHRLDYALWPDSPVLMPAQNLVWWGATLVLVSALYRRFLGAGRIAALALLLYAVDDSRAAPIAWVANRNCLLSLFFGFAALFAYDRWRSKGSVLYAAAAGAAMLAGLLSNEGAIAITAYFFAHALFLDSRPVMRRVAALVPFAVIVLVWRIVYASKGYGVDNADLYIDPLTSPLRFVFAAIKTLPVLLLAQWTPIPPEPMVVMGAGLSVAFAALAVAVVAFGGYVLWPLLRRDATARFFATGMILCLAPACATFPSGRMLAFSAFGAFGVMALFFKAVREGAYEGPPRIAKGFYAFSVASHLIIAPVVAVFSVVGLGTAGYLMRTAAVGAPMPEQDVEKTFVVLNSPSFFITTYLPIIRAHEGLPYAPQLVNLAPSVALPVPFVVTRIDERSLRYYAPTGYQWILLRNDDHPFAVGDTVVFEGRSAEVIRVNEKGCPTEVVFRFATSLDDPALVWLEFDERAFFRNPSTAFRRSAPPRIGESRAFQGTTSMVR
ncbi:MAG: hypothetical protein AAB353_06540 [Candidatus Hydrogenedentota bacterium]